MRFAPERSREEMINLTPLIDMVFILLVFFMLAGAIRPTDAFPVELAVSTSRTFGDERDLVILVRDDGTVAVNNRIMNRPDMVTAVAQVMADNPAALVQVKADADADANGVIAVMEALRESGVGYIVLLTRGASLGPTE